MKENKSFGQRFIESQDKFFKSNAAIITFTSAVAIFALLQLVLFLTTNFEVSGSSDINHWQSWTYMIISPMGAALSLIGYVFTVRVDKRFFWPTMIGQTITSVSSFLGGMVWTGFVMFPIIGFGIARLIIINKNGIDYKLDFKKIQAIGIAILLTISVIGIVMACIEPIYSAFWYTGDTGYAYRLLDVLTANLALYGSILLICKDRRAFYIFILCNIIFMGLFMVSQLWMNALQLLIYIACNICASAAWTYRSKHSDEFK